MLFNSLLFAIFIIIVYSLYLVLPHKSQNRMLLFSSYIFYGAWDWRFITLILFSTFLDYFCALKIFETNSNKTRKQYLLLSIFGNLSILGFFKYFNFFTETLQELIGIFGFHMNPIFLDIILPMGISFYTFQTMSYTIDIYRKEMKPTRQFLDFALFVAFFPQLVAGPIERAKSLLPQILKPRIVNLEKFYEGCFLIFWGLFMKVFIADNLATVVDPIFDSGAPYNGAVVLMGLYGFTFQIFCDFAGYSSIARGLGKIMGFDIMINFNLPFFVTNIQDYWNRWHISLSTWIRDYLYIPLFRILRRVSAKARIYSALMISMTLMGLWHGAAKTYVAFGIYYGILLCLYVIIRTRYHGWINPNSIIGRNLWTTIRMIFMFHFIVIGMLIFRAQYGLQIINMIYALIFNFHFGKEALCICYQVIFFTWVLFLVQLFQYFKKDLMCVYHSSYFVKTVFYSICLFLLIIFGASGEKEFIYFQF